MTNEKVIELVNDAFSGYYSEWAGTFTEAEKDELAEANRMATSALKQAPKWIPVSERLPEKTGIYIVTGKTFISSNNFPNDFYRSTQVHKYSEKTGWDTFFSDEIFAWMPLPEPYKEGEADGQK